MPKNCIIWPVDKSTKSNPCQIHQIERSRLGVGGEFNVKAHLFDNFLLLLDGEVEFGFTPRESGWPAVDYKMQFHERRRRGQTIDKGGYHLDPKEIDGPVDPFWEIND